jgi:thiol-disulfide isomerase/thioredoxin
MKKISMAIFCLSVSMFIFSQNKFIIRGKIDRVTKSDSIILGSSWGTFIGEIKVDGSFLITGEGIKSAGDALIYTDSSNANSIWLEPGEYSIECKEVKLSISSRPLFRISKLNGPKDAEINHGFREQFYEFNSVPADERKQVARNFVIKYIDSVFRNFPISKVLPNLLRSATSLLGDEVVKAYYSLLSDEQKSQPGGEQLANYFNRKEKIDREKFFEDFQMTDLQGNAFKLSSVNKKLILLDFWASDCAPCRRKHPKLNELYKKYANQGFEIISVSFDDTKEDWLKAIAKDNMIWINVSELKGWRTSLSEDYFIKSIPFAIWLDKDKKIISTSDLSEAQIEEYLK